MPRMTCEFGLWRRLQPKQAPDNLLEAKTKSERERPSSLREREACLSAAVWTPSSTIPLASGVFARDSLCISQSGTTCLFVSERKKKPKAPRSALSRGNIGRSEKSYKQGHALAVSVSSRSARSHSPLSSSSSFPPSFSLSNQMHSPFLNHHRLTLNFRHSFL